MLQSEPLSWSAEHPRSEGWSFPCLFYGTQVTRVVGTILTEGVQSTLGVRGEASPAVPKSRELLAPFLMTFQQFLGVGGGRVGGAGGVSGATNRKLHVCMHVWVSK